MRLPPLAVSMGDPAGVGPEICVAALSRPRAPRAFVVGDVAVMERAALLLPGVVRQPVPWKPGEPFPSGAVPVLQVGRVRDHRFGVVRASFGAASIAYFRKAVEMCLDGTASAVVTAPICKEAIWKAGIDFPGHTELVAHVCGVKRYGMMLVGGGLRVMLVTRHVPLSRVPRLITRERVLEAIELAAEGCADLGVTRPRIAVAGLNPHAGEGGGLGSEEQDRIAPAVSLARRRGLSVTGPLPGDTVFRRALDGEFDAVVAMYHDQGLAALKTVAFDRGVNVTVGLPIVRTSVDHGTAMDIAGTGCASDRSMVEALAMASAIARRRAGRPAQRKGGSCARRR